MPASPCPRRSTCTRSPRSSCVCAPIPRGTPAVAEAYFQSALVNRVTATPTEGWFTIDDWSSPRSSTPGFFSHFKLYAWMFRNEQVVEQHRTTLRVETPFPFKSLLEAYTEESWKAKLARDEEAAAEAERVRQEEEAAAARRRRVERLVRKEEEEASHVDPGVAHPSGDPETWTRRSNTRCGKSCARRGPRPRRNRAARQRSSSSRRSPG